MTILRRYPLVAAAFLIMFFGLAGAAFAAGAAAIPGIHFTDLNQAPWAEKGIVKLRLRGIIAGFQDGTFRPNAQVRQSEALVMAVRELGLQQEADTAGKNPKLVLAKEFGKGIPAWVRGYVAVGQSHGLLKPQDKDFSWNAPATRAWLSRLVVRLAGLEQQAVGKRLTKLNFTDNLAVPASARGYVAVAVEKGILAGYPDGSFRPGRAVSRAECSAMFAAAEQLLSRTDILTGTITDITTASVVLRDTKNNLHTLYIADGTWFYRGNEVNLDYSDVRQGDRVVIVTIGATTVGYLEILGSGGSTSTGISSGSTASGGKSSVLIQQTLSGQVVSIDTGDWTLRLEKSSGSRETFSVSHGVDVTIDGESNHDFDEINEDDEVRITIEDDKVVEIEVESEGERTVDGEVVSVDTSDDEIRIEDSDGDRKTYDVDSDVHIVMSGESEPELSDIEKGDEVELRISGGSVDRIEVLDDGSTDESSEYVVGILYRVDSGDDSIRIEDPDGDKTTYEVDSDADINIPGDSSADLSDLETDEPVRLLVEDDVVTEIRQGSLITGTVRTVDDSDNTVKIKDSETDDETTYDVSSDAVIKDEDSGTLDLGDLNRNDAVELYLFGSKVWYIHVTDRN